MIKNESLPAGDPVVDVGFHHELVAQVFPEIEVHGVIVSFALRSFG